MELSNIQAVKGGVNALILRAIADNKEVVVKQYGFERKSNSKAPRMNRDTLENLFKDSLKLRQIVQENNVRIPNVIEHYYVADNCLYGEIGTEQVTSNNANVRLIAIEEYCGTSFKELILSSALSAKEIDKSILMIENLINYMPLETELDVAPSNFTFLQDKVFFVDFMPPKIIGYRDNEKLRDLFPTIAERTKEREKRRIRRYTTTEGRKERFNIYLNEIISKIK